MTVGTLTNLFHPWLAERFLVGTLNAMLALLAGWAALGVLLREQASIAEERRFELVASAFAIAKIGAWAEVFFLVMGADRMAGLLPGTVCAYGVLSANPWGFRALTLALLSAFALSAWQALHSADLTQITPINNRIKARATLLVAPFPIASHLASTAFATQLNLRSRSTCCSTLAIQETSSLLINQVPGAEAWVVFVGASLLATISYLIARFTLSKKPIFSATTLSAIAALSGFFAIPSYLAPHVYESPVHRCPFCLLRSEEAQGYGWLLYAVMAIAFSSSIRTSVLAWIRPHASEKDEVNSLLSSTLQRAAFAWSLTTALGAAPVITYTIAHRGASLFGN
ncbi:MAG: hypothetical protein NZM37_06665 [Sandaracinaceae bacterium]|nr:hypothetical protein [Sandaracinaceae bacterium]